MLFFMLKDPFFLVIPLLLPRLITPTSGVPKRSRMGGMAVLLFDSGKKRIKFCPEFCNSYAHDWLWDKS